MPTEPVMPAHRPMMSTDIRRPKLAFYGDDFTGSTDALEVLAFSGLRVALFVEPPTQAALARVGELDAIGLAGDSRAMTPAQMDVRLPAVFDSLVRCGAPIVHYKVCSTFDSAKNIGSIGHAMRLARPHFGNACIPIVGGTPALKRYCLFAHLFARSATDDHIHRIDRHPIMSRHPLTPMQESDLRIVLGEQGGFEVVSVGFPELDRGYDHARERVDALLAAAPSGLLFDAAIAEHMTTIGRLLEHWSANRSPLFVVGPSGVEYALTQWWRESKTAAQQPVPIPDAGRAQGPVLAISGSASPLSAMQIDAAAAGGFDAIAIDTLALIAHGAPGAPAAPAAPGAAPGSAASAAHGSPAAPAGSAAAAAAELALVQSIVGRLQQGRNVIAYTARGPSDERIAEAIARIESSGRTQDDARREAGATIAARLGNVVNGVLARFPLKRLLISGGDTSTEVVKAIRPVALTIAARLAPGAPLCRMVSDVARVDGVEVALKGGQMGAADFFLTATQGLR